MEAGEDLSCPHKIQIGSGSYCNALATGIEKIYPLNSDMYPILEIAEIPEYDAKSFCPDAYPLCMRYLISIPPNLLGRDKRDGKKFMS